jgi:hypothetical protein
MSSDAKSPANEEAVPKTNLKGVYLAVFENENSQEVDIDVCITNLSDEPQTLMHSQGSFQGDMDGILDLEHSRDKKLTIPAKGSAKIDHFSDAGELDFTTCYAVKVGRREFSACIDGWIFVRKKEIDIPVLNRRATSSASTGVGRRALPSVDRTWRGLDVTSESDPFRTSTSRERSAFPDYSRAAAISDVDVKAQAAER